jgi:hypothetical protein
MPFYFDESIHQRGEFILGAYVFGPDATNAVNAALAAAGLAPDRDEFKSSTKMTEHPEQQALRQELHNILHLTYHYALVVVPHQERESLGREALLGLAKVWVANGLTHQDEHAYFDKGIFPSARRAMELAQQLGVSQYCEVHAEQDSRRVKGLQLADLVAHTCATMLLDALGLFSKLVKAGPNSGYDPDLHIELGFELWVSVRYQFFNGGLPDNVQSNEDMVVEVAPYGLHIAESCSPKLRDAALARFGKQYWGCIH